MASTAFAQRAATVLEQRGDDEFFLNNYSRAAKTYERALQADTSNVFLKLKIADSYRLANQSLLAKSWYEKAFSAKVKNIDPVQGLNFSRVLISLGFEEDAKKLLLEYQQAVGPDPLSTALLSGLKNQQTFEKNIARFAIKRLDFNSPGMDFSPVYYGNGIAFVSSRSKKGKADPEAENFLTLFYTEESEDGSFSVPVPLDGGGVSTYHEGPVIFYDSGRRKILTRNSFVKRSRIANGSVNTLALAGSELLPTGKWTEPQALSLASPEYSVAHPALSSDGMTLYFSSNMPGTIGESDLFMSKFENGAWSAPRNLGPAINTTGQELFPSLLRDTLLYFASNGHSGMGGLDLFVCNLKDTQRTVTNLGAPINSKNDDFGMLMEAGGSSGFFSSNRAGGVGADDIYYFEELQPYAEIKLYDSVTRIPICAATLTLKMDGRIAATRRSDMTGKAQFRLRPLEEYQLSVSAEGYNSNAISLTPALWPMNQQVQVKLYLRPLSIHLENRSLTGLQRRERSGVSNTISFVSSPLDVDVEPEVSDAVVSNTDSVATDSLSTRNVKVIVVEIVNDLPEIILVKSDTIHEMKLQTGSVLIDSDLNVSIEIPQGAKRNDYEGVIRKQLSDQGFSISRFLLIRSFFFDSGKSLVRNDASAQLDKIIEVMHAFGKISLEMIFHADSRGTDAFNLELSKARADEVKLYLANAGIDTNRIISRFVGEGQLLVDCVTLADCDEMLHQINRTAEFKFLVK